MLRDTVIMLFGGFSTEGNPFKCQRRCGKKKNCGRHKCSDNCCVVSIHCLSPVNIYTAVLTALSNTFSLIAHACIIFYIIAVSVTALCFMTFSLIANSFIFFFLLVRANNFIKQFLLFLIAV